MTLSPLLVYGWIIKICNTIYKYVAQPKFNCKIIFFRFCQKECTRYKISKIIYVCCWMMWKSFRDEPNKMKSCIIDATWPIILPFHLLPFCPTLIWSIFYIKLRAEVVNNHSNVYVKLQTMYA